MVTLENARRVIAAAEKKAAEIGQSSTVLVGLLGGFLFEDEDQGDDQDDQGCRGGVTA